MRMPVRRQGTSRVSGMSTPRASHFRARATFGGTAIEARRPGPRTRPDPRGAVGVMMIAKDSFARNMVTGPVGLRPLNDGGMDLEARKRRILRRGIVGTS